MEEVEIELSESEIKIIDQIVESKGYENRDEFIIELIEEMVGKTIVHPASTDPMSGGHEDFHGEDLVIDVRSYGRELWEEHDDNLFEKREPGIYFSEDNRDNDDTTVIDIIVDSFDLEKYLVEKEINVLNEKYDFDVHINWSGKFGDRDA